MWRDPVALAIAVSALVLLVCTVYYAVTVPTAPLEHVANLLRIAVLFNMTLFYFVQFFDPGNTLLGWSVERLWSRLNAGTILSLFVVWLLARCRGRVS